MAKPKSKPKQESRRRKIVLAAAECFLEFGISETRLSEVAKRAGVDPPLVHYYFPSVDQLQMAVIQTIFLEDLKAESVAAIQSHANAPLDALFAYARAPFLWAKRSPGPFALTMYFYYLAAHREPYRLLNQEIRDVGRERIKMLLYAAQEKSGFKLPKGCSVTEMAIWIQGLITGNTILAATEKNLDLVEMADRTVTEIQIFLKSM